jgi:hypothetical protein
MDITQARIESIKFYQQAETRKAEQRLEERREKYHAEITEQERIEQNRRMNRAGQNIDRMA